MGIVVSLSHLSASPSSPEGGLLTLFLCSSVRSLSQETFLHKVIQHESFPQAAALHKLLQCESLLIGCSPSGTGCFSVGPHGVTSPASKPATAWAPLSMGPQVLAGAYSSAGFPQGHSLLRVSICCGTGSSVGCRWINAPPWISKGCRETACLTMVFFTGCRRISTPVPGALLPSPSSLTLVSAEFSVLSLPAKCHYTGFFFLLKYVITEVLPLSLTASGLASGRSILELAGICSVGHRESF